MNPAVELFDALGRVTTLQFHARGRLWTGSGFGAVQVASPTEGVLTFTESGSWRSAQGREFRFNNVFRWSVVGPERVRLEHLRFGPEHPVELFELVPAPGGWRSDQSHVCKADCYTAELQLRVAGIWVVWQVAGPKKDEAIEYTYGT